MQATNHYATHMGLKLTQTLFSWYTRSLFNAYYTAYDVTLCVNDHFELYHTKKLVLHTI